MVPAGCWRFIYCSSIHICQQQKFLPSSLSQNSICIFLFDKLLRKLRKKRNEWMLFCGKDIYLVSVCMVQLHPSPSVVHVNAVSASTSELLLRFALEWIWSQRQHDLEKLRKLNKKLQHTCNLSVGLLFSCTKFF